MKPSPKHLASREMFLDAGSREGTRAVAREILMMDAADYAAAFKGSAIKRAKRRVHRTSPWRAVADLARNSRESNAFTSEYATPRPCTLQRT